MLEFCDSRFQLRDKWIDFTVAAAVFLNQVLLKLKVKVPNLLLTLLVLLFKYQDLALSILLSALGSLYLNLKLTDLDHASIDLFLHSFGLVLGLLIEGSLKLHGSDRFISLLQSELCFF